MKVENEIIHYKAITEKSITQPYNKILHSKCTVLLKAYDYCMKNKIRTIDNQDIIIKVLNKNE